MTDLLSLVRKVVERVEGNEQLEAFAVRQTKTSVKAYEGEVEAFTQAATQGIGIRVVNGTRQGFAYAGSLDLDIIDDTLEEARDNARFAEEDEFVGLAEPDNAPVIHHDLWSDELVEFPVDDKIALAIELERRVREGDPRISGVRSASFGDSASEAAVATSTGIGTYGRGTACSVGVSALADDRGEGKVGYGFDVARSPLDLAVDKAAADAIERATQLFGATQPESGRVAIVLEPRLAASIIGLVGGMLTGERVLKGRSPFAERVGEQIAATAFTLVDDPTNPASFGADSHDGEGLACRRNELIVDGVLQGFLHNTRSGRRAGCASTGSAVRGYASTPGVGAQALAVTPGSASIEDLIGKVDHGVYVTSMVGLNSGVNAVSGDFSVGVEGLMIRNGTLAEPIREATIASTVQKMLTDIIAIGDDLEWQPGGTGAATLLIGDLALSGR